MDCHGLLLAEENEQTHAIGLLSAESLRLGQQQDSSALTERTRPVQTEAIQRFPRALQGSRAVISLLL